MDGHPMSGESQDMTGRKKETDHPRSSAECVAHRSMEEHFARPVGDEEWGRIRERLLEFIRTLARWDRERRKAPSAVENEDRKLAS